ncbi:MAG: hypothetical protein E7Z63_06225 [Thermoplasmata archaeon]|nr:hypothetical protein [Thermoplasmata archaeon]
MESRVPTDEEIEGAVREVIRLRRRVESQTELRRLVIEKLSTPDCTVRATASRIRRVALTRGAASVEIDYRDAFAELPEICPVCKGGMMPVRSVNLDGDTVEISRNCSVCAFTASGKMRKPARYAFVKAKGQTDDRTLRIRKLRKAAALLRLAEKLIKESVENTPAAGRTDFSAEMINKILKDRDEPGSVRNLEADLKDEGGPLWTRPLDSPKRPNKKDM